MVKGIFDSWSAFFSREMANFFFVNRDFHSSREAWFCKIILRETRNKCLICCEPWFSLCLCYFRQPLLRNKWYCVTSRLIPVVTTWSTFLVTFGQPSFSFSTIMAKAHQVHQLDVQDDQNVTVLIRKRKVTKNYWFTRNKAGTLPLNMYQTAVHREERLEFAPVERVEQPEFSK